MATHDAPRNNTRFFFDPFNNRILQRPSVLQNADPIQQFAFSTLRLPQSASLSEFRYKHPHYLAHIGLLGRREKKWKTCKYRAKDFDVSLVPPILNRGLVYFVYVKGDVATFDINRHDKSRAMCINKGCMRQRRLRKNIREHFLIKPKDDNTIYVVFGMMREERDVKVFRLVESYKMRWEAVDNLGEKVFYVSNSSSNGYSTSDKSMANKIFFPKLHGDKLVFYCLETEKYHSFDDNYSSQDSHGLKRLDFATWTMPTQQINSSDHLSWRLKVDETANLISSSFRSRLLRWLRRIPYVLF